MTDHERVELARTIVESSLGLGVLVVCALKGKWGFVMLGFALPILWVIGAGKLAKPRSWWAHHYYGDVSLSQAEQHFVLSRRTRPPASG